ncbi:hypothetical protein [Breznakiella homolactica]|uniref:Lipoprotein n=1 Tax=Breznakiella homolactica TaxID=2798577 RepID=A0A7T8B9D4_9SPIR|nr:hypothetical protein [Breznakiella homolactica]QQO08211.1 hypothetical protein JFL75_14900 [Breznakiella homolactica]
MKRLTLSLYCIIAAILPVLLGSCIGVDAEISLSGNGSGSMVVRYRISRELESLGELDGNARWLPIPVGKADVERTVRRIPGLALDSYNAKTDGDDTVHTVKLKFASLEALAQFLDGTGRYASITGKDGGSVLTIDFPGNPELNPDLTDLVRESCEGYDFRIAAGNGRRNYEISMADLLTSKDPVRIEIEL